MVVEVVKEVDVLVVSKDNVFWKFNKSCKIVMDKLVVLENVVYGFKCFNILDVKFG